MGPEAWPDRLPEVLGVATDPAWLAVALADLPSTLGDHAHAEKKAALSALSLLSREPARTGLVNRMAKLAREELDHLDAVLAHLRRRGWPLAADRPDRYARRLLEHRRAGGQEALADRLLCAGLIEARSWERLRMLAEGLAAAGGEDELADFYRGLARAEAGHYRLFVQLAEDECATVDVRGRLGELAAAEAAIIRTLPHEARIH